MKSPADIYARSAVNRLKINSNGQSMKKQKNIILIAGAI